jgi:hypothetical protein
MCVTRRPSNARRRLSDAIHIDIFICVAQSATLRNPRRAQAPGAVRVQDENSIAMPKRLRPPSDGRFDV